MINENTIDALLTDILAHGVPSATLGAYFDEIRWECAEIAVSSFIANVTRSEIATGNDYAVLVIADHIRADIMGNG